MVFLTFDDPIKPDPRMVKTLYPSVKKIFNNFAIALISCNVAVITITFMLTKLTAQDHFGEKTFFSIYSGLQIYLVAFTVLFCFLTGKITGNNSNSGLLFIAAFISFLASDEIFELHENGKMITTATGYLFQWEPGIFYGELMTLISYLIVALITLWMLKKELSGLPVFRNLILGGSALFVLSLAVDLVLWQYLSIIFEEGSKVLGFGLIELAFLYLYLDTVAPQAVQENA